MASYTFTGSHSSTIVLDADNLVEKGQHVLKNAIVSKCHRGSWT